MDATLEQPRETLPDRGNDDRLLHIVGEHEYPKAMCGHIVTDPWDPNRTDTAGRDRCTACILELRRRRRGR